ncbi:Kinetochore protein mis14 [Colletotrichum sp. SAR 10_65]|nr:Kinetochore protein mis14 [Colletotrichum sp. SAR 10_65]
MTWRVHVIARRVKWDVELKARDAEVLPLDEVERQGETKAAFMGAVERVGKLKKDMPATVAKMERTRVADEYTVTERS